MKETFVLDASALIAFFNNENGADKVEDILQRAKKDNEGEVKFCWIR